MKVKSLNRARLLATPWTAAYQAPPSMGFSRQEYWSGLPLPSPEIFFFLLMIFKFFNSIQLFEGRCVVIHVSFLISAIWKVTCDAITGPGEIMGGHGDGCRRLVGPSLECLSEWVKPPFSVK